MVYKYKISILSMFKNEAMIMEEWIQHYISEGIEHFYLIDNGSTDNYDLIIKKYAEKITLVIDSSRDKDETQPLLFNRHFLSRSKIETEWLLVCDMDEYIYSRNGYRTIKEYINKVPENIDCILLPWKNFGNNGVDMHPDSIISTFIRREDEIEFKKRIVEENWFGHSKSLFRTKNVTRLNTHIPILVIENIRFSDFTGIDMKKYDGSCQPLHLNHYQHMSYHYYTKVKMIRGDAQTWFNRYNLTRFHRENTIFNKIDDHELANKK